MVEPERVGLIICVTEPGYIQIGLTGDESSGHMHWEHALRVATALCFAAEQAALEDNVELEEFKIAIKEITEDTIRNLRRENDTSPAQEADLN